MDEQTNEYQVLDKENEVVEKPVEQESAPVVKEVIIKKKKQKSPENTTRAILIAILVVGICLLAVSLFGIFNSVGNISDGDVADTETTTSADNQSTPVINTPETTTADNGVNENVPNPDDNADTQGGENADNTASTAPQTDAEWLTFFSTAVNKLKTDGPSFSKAKRTQTADIQLSNPLAQAYVSTAKDKYLSDETVVTDVAKGDKSTATAVVSPDGSAFVSNLSMSDIKSITHTVNADGNYEITINMPEATNPDTSSSYAKIFEFMLVDDVMDTYAPNMGATVDRENVYLEYSGCYAKAVITPEGKVVSYETKVNANMILKSAKISVVTTDLDVTLYSDTSYTNIVW
ncbi:MAG: hypothetical protein IJZ35_05505 [Clostridia bacterium]|nr:hypothetical protein [Clostridia bacterium]